MAIDSSGAVVLIARDGTRAAVTRDAVVAAVEGRRGEAAGPGPGTHVLVGKARVPAVWAVAAAAGLAESNVRTADAVRALATLGFEVSTGGGPRPVSSPRVRQNAASAGRAADADWHRPAGQRPHEDRAHPAGAVPADTGRRAGPTLPGPMLEPPPSARTVLSDATAKALRRHTGRWVALRDGQVAGTGGSAREAMATADATPASPVTVLFVPPAPGPDGP